MTQCKCIGPQNGARACPCKLLKGEVFDQQQRSESFLEYQARLFQSEHHRPLGGDIPGKTTSLIAPSSAPIGQLWANPATGSVKIYAGHENWLDVDTNLATGWMNGREWT